MWREAVTRAADWLALAAAPTFAAMAVMTAVAGEGTMAGLCSAVGSGPFNGMVPMYLLMSVFHLGPWIRAYPLLRSSRRMPGPRWNGFEADAKGSESFQSSTPPTDLGPGIRRDERIREGQ